MCLCRDAIGQQADPAVMQRMADTVLQLLDTLLANLLSKVHHISKYCNQPILNIA